MDWARIIGIVIGAIGGIAYAAVWVKLTFYYPDPYWPQEQLDLAFLIPLIFVIVGLGMVFWPRKKV
jgi:hypothetical protein